MRNNTQKILSAWKEGTATETTLESEALVDEQLMRNTSGGKPIRDSAGWICSISGECNSTGESCNPF